MEQDDPNEKLEKIYKEKTDKKLYYMISLNKLVRK